MNRAIRSARASKPALRVLVVGDSLCRPRDGIAPEQVYAELLRQRFAEANGDAVEIFVDAKGGRTVRGGLKALQNGALECAPDAVVIQLGVVDSAPRILTQRQKRLLSMLRPVRLRERVIRFLHDHRALILTRIRAAAYVKPRPFGKCLAQMAQLARSAGAKHVAFVSIAPTTDAMAEHSPPWPARILAYNEIVRGVARETGCDYIDLYAQIAPAVDTYIMPDGHHLTVEGNTLYAEALSSVVEEWMSKL